LVTTRFGSGGSGLSGGGRGRHAGVRTEASQRASAVAAREIRGASFYE
jgi:hypothetical protein